MLVIVHAHSCRLRCTGSHFIISLSPLLFFFRGNLLLIFLVDPFKLVGNYSSSAPRIVVIRREVVIIIGLVM